MRWWDWRRWADRGREPDRLWPGSEMHPSIKSKMMVWWQCWWGWGWCESHTPLAEISRQINQLKQVNEWTNEEDTHTQTRINYPVDEAKRVITLDRIRWPFFPIAIWLLMRRADWCVLAAAVLATGPLAEQWVCAHKRKASLTDLWEHFFGTYFWTLLFQNLSFKSETLLRSAITSADMPANRRPAANTASVCHCVR